MEGTSTKERGVEDVLLFVSDGFKRHGGRCFHGVSKAKYQVCLVHVGRNLAHKVRIEDRQEIFEDFLTIHQATDAETAGQALDTFCDKWGKSYKKVTQSLLENPIF
uniref:transposase n=1 Tax=Bacillus xiapuensis TaxID=2014075 RepID=UPI0038BB025D